MVGTGNCCGSGGCAQACGRAKHADASARDVVTDKISSSSLNSNFFPLTFIRKGKGCGGKIVPLEVGGAVRGGPDGGECLLVIRPGVENGWGGVETFHLFGQLGLVSDRDSGGSLVLDFNHN